MYAVTNIKMYAVTKIKMYAVTNINFLENGGQDQIVIVFDNVQNL